MIAGSWLEQLILAVVLLLSLAFVLRRAVRVFSAKKGGGCNCSGKSCCATPKKVYRIIPITVIDEKKD